jgi:uncharacterized integral membrane protein
MFKKISIITKKIIFLLIFAIFAAFIFTNRDFVEVNLIPFGYKIKTRIFLLVIISFFAGIIFEYFCNMFNIARIMEKISNRKKIKNMENELKKMKGGENENK